MIRFALIALLAALALLPHDGAAQSRQIAVGVDPAFWDVTLAGGPGGKTPAPPTSCSWRAAGVAR